MGSCCFWFGSFLGYYENCSFMFVVGLIILMRVVLAYFLEMCLSPTISDHSVEKRQFANWSPSNNQPKLPTNKTLNRNNADQCQTCREPFRIPFRASFARRQSFPVSMFQESPCL